jgi:hypothetical protein
MRRELRDLLRSAEARGWQLEVTRRATRLRLAHPDGAVVVAGMPGDRQALANLREQLRQAERGTTA